MRIGPRPLPLHLMVAWTHWASALAALPFLKNALPGSKPLGAIAAAIPEIADAAVDGLSAATAREILRRSDLFLRGIERYRKHPYHRDPSGPAEIWREGSTRVLDYGGAGPPLLLVPSLVNRAYILDLAEGNSFARTATRGARVLLVDWDAPGEAERGFDLAAYVARLERITRHVGSLAGRPPVVLGYCMGGLFVMALAARAPQTMRAMVLLATPWDFHADRPESAQGLARSVEPWLPLIDASGEMPVDMLQALFAALDPLLAYKKFARFADMPEAAARGFVALEDWLNDGIPLVAPVARECVLGWYGQNLPGRGLWRVGETVVRPADITLPALVVVPEQDRIVPPLSAAALANGLPRAERLDVSLGHIGMVAGARSRAMSDPVLAWVERAFLDSGSPGAI